LSLIVEAYVHSVTHGLLRNPQHTACTSTQGVPRRADRKWGKLHLNRSFRVIQGHPYWYQQKFRTGCCRNVQ